MIQLFLVLLLHRVIASIVLRHDTDVRTYLKKGKKKNCIVKLVPQNVQAITLSLTVKNGCKNLFCAIPMAFQTLRKETVCRDFHSSTFSSLYNEMAAYRNIMAITG